VRSFDQGTTGTIFSKGPLLILDIFGFQNMPTFKIRKARGCFLKTTFNRTLREIHEKTQFQTSIKVYEIPARWRKQLWNKLHGTDQKNQGWTHSFRLRRDEASISKQDI